MAKKKADAATDEAETVDVAGPAPEVVAAGAGTDPGGPKAPEEIPPSEVAGVSAIVTESTGEVKTGPVLARWQSNEASDALGHTCAKLLTKIGCAAAVTTTTYDDAPSVSVLWIQ